MAQVTLNRLTLSVAKLRGLPAFDRYVFALAGHIFNDLMVGQKLMLGCRPRHDGVSEFENEASVGLGLYMLRVLVGRLHEAMCELTKQAIEDHVRQNYFSPIDGLVERWTSAVAQYEQMEAHWMTAVRNSQAFHYMSQGQWAPVLEAPDWEGAEMIAGDTYGNTFFTWADQMAGLAMSKRVDANKPFEGLGHLIDQTYGLMGQLGDCLAEGLQHYVVRHLADPDSLGQDVPVAAPTISELHAPYFVAPDAAKPA